MANYPDVKTDIVNDETQTDESQINNLEDYVGIIGDTEPTSITHKLTNPSSVSPGHLHPIGNLSGGSNGSVVYKDPFDSIWKAVLPDAAGLVTKTDEQTISAKKTFEVLPEADVTPTTENQLVRKKYVDDLILLPKYGSMYRHEYPYEDPANVYKNEEKAMGGFYAGGLEGITKPAATEGEVLEWSDNGNGTVKAYCPDHSLLNMDIITIHETSTGAYNGKFVITRLDPDYFTIVATYVAQTGGRWYRPSCLVVGSSAAGIYQIDVNCHMISDEITEEGYYTFSTFKVMKGIVPIDSLELRIGAKGGYRIENNDSRSAIVTLAAYDKLWMCQINTSDLYIYAPYADLTINRIDR